MLRLVHARVSKVAAAIAALGLGIGGALITASAQPATAGPALPLDHFLCYQAQALSAGPGFTVPAKVKLANQFSNSIKPSFQGVALHCNPATKTVPVITASGGLGSTTYTPQSPDWHLLCFTVKTNTQKPHIVVVNNQFGNAVLETGQPNLFCLPSLKSFQPGAFTPPAAGEVQPDHFLCYPVTYLPGTAPVTPPPVLQVSDQFTPASGPPTSVQVLSVTSLCLPTQKTIAKAVTPISNPTMHLLCFATAPPTPVPTAPIYDKNQFSGAAGGALTVLDPNGNQLCLPSTKVLIK